MGPLWVITLLAVSGCGSGSAPALPAAPAGIRLESPDFANGATIPRQFTCDGSSAIPTLRWSGVPAGTRGLALFVDDPDAPGGTFPHWSVWELSPGLRQIARGHVPNGAREGQNGTGHTGWTAPCPPKGDKPHRYVFTLFALKKPLDAADGAGAADARNAVGDSALARGQLVGRYGR